MDENPFAPPRTEDLDGPVPTGDHGALDDEAVRALRAAGRWTSLAAVLGLGAMVLLVVQGALVLGHQLSEPFARFTLLLNAVAIPTLGPLVWFSQGFARAVGGLAEERPRAVERSMEAQRRLLTVYAVLALLTSGLLLLGLAMGFLAARRGW